MSKIVGFKMGKGKSIESPDEKQWSKEYLELEVAVPEGTNLGDALLTAEKCLNTWLGIPIPMAPQTPGEAQIPEFDPGLLMNHPWKGKKTGDNQYDQGSAAWGWDFRDKFPAYIIELLKKGSLVIDKYEFALGDNLVSAKEKKGNKRR